MLKHLLSALRLGPSRLIADNPWWLVTLCLASAAAVGFAIVAGGLVPVKASAGHWAITNWFLQLVKTRSVATHAMVIDAPPLEDRGLAVRGARHYDLGCRPCHGSGRGDMPRIPQRMLPPPPDLRALVPARSSEELFYVVKHGLKFTGMPAWPAQQRDDEVWAVVAFLRRLPQLQPEEYVRMTRSHSLITPDVAALDVAAESAPSRPPDIVSENCARCHGADGEGNAEAVLPRLAGQRREYLSRALRAYADGQRHSGIMGPIASSMRSSGWEDAVSYYASLPAAATGGVVLSPSVATRGEEIATRGIPRRDVPACAECHGPSSAPKNDAYPILAGQHGDYLAQQLQLLQNRQRGGSEYVHMMHSFVDRLTSDQIHDVAAYYASF